MSLIKKLVNNQQVIADLMTNAYTKLDTGGIIKYLDLSVIPKKDLNNKQDYYNDIQDSGYILWISEETHDCK